MSAARPPRPAAGSSSTPATARTCWRADEVRGLDHGAAGRGPASSCAPTRSPSASTTTSPPSAWCVRLALRGRHRGAASASAPAAWPPRRCAPSQTEAVLRGQPWTADTARAGGASVLRAEFQPISDMRASAAYRSEVLGNLMQRFWLESQGAARHQPGAASGLRGAHGMNARDKRIHARPPAADPAAPADAGERNLAPGHAVAARAGRTRPADGRARARTKARAPRWRAPRPTSTTCPRCGHAARGADPLDRGARHAARRRRARGAGHAGRARRGARARHSRRPDAGHLRARRADLRARHGAAHRPGDRPGGGRHGDAGAPRGAQGASSTSSPCPPCSTCARPMRRKATCCRR